MKYFLLEEANGRKRTLFFQDIREMEDKEIISGFIKQYYIDSQNLPNKIMIREELEDQQAIEQWLSKEAGRKVEIKSPKKVKN